MKKNTTVFIVEDEMLIAACLKNQLEEAGFTILGNVTRGEKSIEEIQRLREENNEPDIVLMDINLRGAMNGIDTAHEISNRYNCGIIFLTGQSSKEVYKRSFCIKPFGYVLKPYDLEQMIMTIEIAAYQRRLELENKRIRKELEQLLSEKTKENTEVLELYKAIIENSLAAICIIQEGRFVFANQAIANTLGYTLEEIFAMEQPDIVRLAHPADRERLLSISEKRLQGMEVPQYTTFRIITKEGEIRWMKSFVKLVNYMGKPALHQTFLDVTDYINR